MATTSIASISEIELQERIALNERRLNEPYYQLPDVYQEEAAEWPGDKEGRALLAFVCHANMTGRENPCMHEMVRLLPSKLNERGYLGLVKDCIFEQQLSGHSWMLRGLCAYYERYGDDSVKEILYRIAESLYRPCMGHFASYPLKRYYEEGEVSGTSVFMEEGWLLSSDTCCAFMSIDGLSHFYAVTKEPWVRTLLEEMITVFRGIDKSAIKAQTHCSLTASRGMIRMYQQTGEAWYLDGAKEIMSLYENSGMTLTYQNLNWWGRPDSWTEPCAIVDSLMAAGELYKITGDWHYRTLATRIYHNGFAFMQRPNGGAGPDHIVNGEKKILAVNMYEAYFCCTMRLAEGLLYAWDNRSILEAERTGTVSKDEFGRYMDGDWIYAEVQRIEIPEYEKELGITPIMMDGHRLQPIVKCYRLSEEQASAIQLQVCF